MKNLNKKNILMVSMLICLITVFTFCTKHDQVLDLSTPAPSDAGTNTLTSVFTNTAPTFIEQTSPFSPWGGTVESQWSNAPAMSVVAIVPDVPFISNNFIGFQGNSTTVTMKSMYDANNIYFLVEWVAQQNVQSTWWYFDTVSKVWAQEKTSLVVDTTTASVIKTPFTQDKFAMLFNVDSSCYAFKSQGCYGTCHLDMNDAAGAPHSFMHTNGTLERLDMWWADMIQATNFNQMMDGYQDEGMSTNQFTDGRNNDDNSSNHSTAAKPKFPQTNKGTKYPLYVTKASSATPFATALFGKDTVNGGSAILVTGGSPSGTLYLANGDSIVPTADYQAYGNVVGKYCIPGSIYAPFTGSRADITCNAYYTGTSWRLLIKRKLNTGDINKRDINFSNLVDQPFGIGVFFNHANNQHAIVSGLTLKFQK